ncbi:MAG: hypothetical protein AAFP77_11230 [Bacteroidota bacterium]
MSNSLLPKWLRRLETFFLSERSHHNGERWVIYFAIVGFLFHLLLIILNQQGMLDLSDPSKLLTSPLSAVYTPFSIILLYEVYLLIFYLPKSTTDYINKQYEIITLIVIRRLFKDLANVELSADWFKIKSDLEFTYDLAAAALLFFLIFVFNRLNDKRLEYRPVNKAPSQRSLRFVRTKTLIALLLAPTFLIMASYSFYVWLRDHVFEISAVVEGLKDVNSVFFDEFFTVLILVDILLLLASFLYTNRFYTIMRNSGFILSTILLRLSFTVDSLISVLLSVTAVVIGIVFLYLHNLYERVRYTKEANAQK